MGKGFPLHKLEIAQEVCLIKFLSFVELAILTNGSIAPAFNNKSLYFTQSPLKLPTAQTAWSTIPVLF